MNISETFIHRPIATSLLMAGVALFGIIAYASLSVSDLPQVDYPTITVNASLPGANPDTMASAVATPLERQFTTIAGLDSMISNSRPGLQLHHPAIQPQPRYRWRHCGRRNRHRRGHAAAASRHADAALLPQGQPRRPAHHQPLPHLSHHAPVRSRRVRRDHARAAHLHGGRRGPGAGLSARPSTPCACRWTPTSWRPAVSASTKSITALHNWNVNVPTGTLYGPHTAYNVQANGQLMKAVALPSDGRGLPQRRAGPLGRRRQRDRQRGGR